MPYLLAQTRDPMHKDALGAFWPPRPRAALGHPTTCGGRRRPREATGSQKAQPMYPICVLHGSGHLEPLSVIPGRLALPLAMKKAEQGGEKSSSLIVIFLKNKQQPNYFSKLFEPEYFHPMVTTDSTKNKDVEFSCPTRKTHEQQLVTQENRFFSFVVLTCTVSASFNKESKKQRQGK